MNYFDYIKGIDKCTETSPFESSYQEILSRFLEDELINLKIEVIVSKDFPRRCTQNHCTGGYKKPGTASPDLILAKNFYYYNLDNKVLREVDYHALVEIKIPNTINVNREFISLKSHDENQLKTYLNHPSINKLIFTDGYTWVFYYKEFIPSSKRIIELRDGENWKLDGNNSAPPKEWEELQSYISKFLKDSELVSIQEKRNDCNN